MTTIDPSLAAAGRPARGTRPIVWHLACLALAALVPFFALAAFLATRVVEHDILDARKELHQARELAAGRAARFAQRVRLNLALLADRPAVRALDPRRCDPLLVDLLHLNREFANVFTTDAEGAVVCSALAVPETSARLDMAPLRRAGNMVIGVPVPGPISGRRVMVASFPVRGPARELTGMVAIAIDVAAWGDSLGADIRTQDALLVAHAASGRPILRMPETAAQVEPVADADEVALLAAAGREGEWRGGGVAGPERLWSYSTVPGTGWKVFTGAAVERVQARAWDTAATLLAAALAASLLVGFLCLRLVRPITRAMGGIAGAARQMARGKTLFHVAEEGPAEAVALSRELNAMIDHRSAIESQLARERSRLAGLVEAAMDAIVTVDGDHRVRIFNPAAERMFGISREAMLGEGLERLIPPAHREAHHRHIEAFGRSGRSSASMGAGGVIHALRADGSTFPAEASISHVDAGGERWFTAILRDVSEREQREAEIQRLNEDLERRVAERTAELEAANRDLEAFDYSLSHDLRAPLNRITGFTAALAQDHAGQLGEPARDLLERVRAASSSLEAMVDDFLRLASVTRGELKRDRVDVAALARSIAASLQAGDTTRRVEVLVQEPLEAHADPAMLHTALEHLLSNAWKFTRYAERPSIAVGAREEGGRLVYFVRDNGRGFELDRRLHGAREIEGTGIGLATVKRVVHRHGGWCRATGAFGEGAEFTFTLSR